MANCTICKFALAIVILLAVATPGRAQVAPTHEELARVLRDRIHTLTQAEVATLRTKLQSAVKAEQQAEGIRMDRAGEVCRLIARREFLDWLAREYPRMRGNMDQGTMQQVNSWQREIQRLNAELPKFNERLKSATTAWNDARARRLQVERAVASKESKNLQQFSELTNLYNMWRLNPPRVTREAMMGRLTEVAREKNLTSNVTVSAGAAPVTVRYQLVNGGQIYSSSPCTQCLIRPPVGYYNFWIESRGAAAPPKTAHFIFRESHSIQLSEPNPSSR